MYIEIATASDFFTSKWCFKAMAISLLNALTKYRIGEAMQSSITKWEKELLNCTSSTCMAQKKFIKCLLLYKNGQASSNAIIAVTSDKNLPTWCALILVYPITRQVYQVIWKQDQIWKGEQHSFSNFHLLSSHGCSWNIRYHWPPLNGILTLNKMMK